MLVRKRQWSFGYIGVRVTTAENHGGNDYPCTAKETYCAILRGYLELRSPWRYLLGKLTPVTITQPRVPSLSARTAVSSNEQYRDYITRRISRGALGKCFLHSTSDLQNESIPCPHSTLNILRRSVSCTCYPNWMSGKCPPWEFELKTGSGIVHRIHKDQWHT